MGEALRVSGLRMRYGRRSPWALDDLTCAFPTGAICGLVGPNGAGKTTLFSVICGYLTAQEGEVDILGGGPFDPWRLKGRLGVLPQDASLDGRLTSREFLRYMGRLQGMGAAEGLASADAALDAVNLRDKSRARVSTLSHGMRRRLAVASALLGWPELILLDEPTAGLDPVQAHSLRQNLLDRKGRSTLVVSSHNLAELERICDHVVLVEHGHCVRQGSVEEVTGRGSRVVWEIGPGDPPLDTLRALLPDHEFALEAHGDGGFLTQLAPTDADLDAASVVVTRSLAEAEIPVRSVRRGRSLEESFLDGRLDG